MWIEPEEGNAWGKEGGSAWGWGGDNAQQGQGEPNPAQCLVLGPWQLQQGQGWSTGPPFRCEEMGPVWGSDTGMGQAVGAGSRHSLAAAFLYNLTTTHLKNTAPGASCGEKQGGERNSEVVPAYISFTSAPHPPVHPGMLWGAGGAAPR